MKAALTIIAFFCLCASSFAQELNCRVQVQAPTVQSSNQQVFDDLQRSIYEFINNTKWTNEKFKIEERIECSMLITVSDYQNGKWQATIQVTSSRPVFNSTYKSQLLNVNDGDFDFAYLQNTPIEFSPNQHRSNLASVLAFYAYIILGADYDTYSMEGGSPYYIKAQQIVNNASNAPEPGWKAFEGQQNRYWLVDNILHQRFKAMRECTYKYHRQGFDKLYDDMEGGRAAITQSLELLRKVHQARPSSYNMQLWFLAKGDEIVNLYSQAFPQEKTRVYNLLKQIDAIRASKYQEIMKSGK